MNPLTQSKNTTILPVLIALTLCFALSPQARAVCQDACLTNQNTAHGDDALISLATGFSNTAIGYHAFYSDTTGYDSTAIGNDALAHNNTGYNNTAIGSDALTTNTGGVQNTATGAGALANNTTGYNNTAAGAGALVFNATGNNNTATGLLALQSRFGSNNTGTGVFAVLNNTAGNNNIAVGSNAGSNLTTGDNNIDIGNTGRAGESKTIRIGTKQIHMAAFIAGISGATVPTGVAVIVDANGHLGTTTSSACYKDGIKPMDKASEAILSLKPVTFRYKKELDPDGIPQFGLVAEDVEKVNPDLVARDADGKAYTVRYEAVNAMLLNEFLKAHRRMEEQDKRIEELTVQLKQQAAQIQKVSAQLELSKPAPQTAENTLGTYWR